MQPRWRWDGRRRRLGHRFLHRHEIEALPIDVDRSWAVHRGKAHARPHRSRGGRHRRPAVAVPAVPVPVGLAWVGATVTGGQRNPGPDHRTHCTRCRGNRRRHHRVGGQHGDPAGAQPAGPHDDVAASATACPKAECGRLAIGGIGGERPHDGFGQSGRHGGATSAAAPAVRTHGGRAGCESVAVVLEGQPAGEQLVEHRADRVDVGRRGQLARPGPARAPCTPACRAPRPRAWPSSPAPPTTLAMPKSVTLSVAGAGEHEVLGLDVAVEHPAVVGALQRRAGGQRPPRQASSMVTPCSMNRSTACPRRTSP